MYDYKISILFYLQKSKKNKRNKCSVICRLTYNKKRKQFSTGISLEEIDWDAKKQVSKDNQINDQLEIISSEIKSVFLKLKISQTPFTVNDIYKEFKGETKSNEYGVIEYYNLELAKKKKLIDIELNQATWNKFLYISNHLKEFVKWKYDKSDVLLNNLTMNFLSEFEFFLKTEKKHQQITVNKATQRFKSVIRAAVGEQIIDKNPFYAHKPKKVRKKVIYLNQEELGLLEHKKITQVRLDAVRDCFVFCCYTGLAYKEMASLKKEHLIKGFDNLLWIQMTRKKTDKTISVPVLAKALKIIQKYSDVDEEYVLPIISNQRFNSYLKEVAAIVGVNKNLTHHMARKTFASTVLLYNDVPMEIVSELLGHSSIRVTESHYGKIVQNKVSEHILKLSEKLKEK
ncbi:tyrosine-type recombinase/integrase [Mesonia ostreae]|uniref:Site-specific integrase n=1 Tax=Mesonia ostreae TaxID=861110 RepID=A0ABU2KHB6_9FLAO|nr:site-specific integrase [Mesonia ostreae]MDT0294096.1 site-specific integrase [Mesonia ostreae]